MDQDTSFNDKNEELKTMVLRPSKHNQGFRIQGPRSSGYIIIKTLRTRTTGPKYLQQKQEQELDKNKECGTLAYQGNY